MERYNRKNIRLQLRRVGEGLNWVKTPFFNPYKDFTMLNKPVSFLKPSSSVGLKIALYEVGNC